MHLLVAYQHLLQHYYQIESINTKGQTDFPQPGNPKLATDV